MSKLWQGLKRQLAVTKDDMAPAGGCDKGAPRRQLRLTAFVAVTKVKSPVQPPNKKAPETTSDALKMAI